MRTLLNIGTMALLATTVACGAQLEPSSDLSPSDPLYARVKAECGDSLIVRVEDLGDDESVCCVTYTAFIPHLHCMTANGATVANPESTAKIKAVAAAAK